jgi:hypothetical protein
MGFMTTIPGAGNLMGAALAGNIAQGAAGGGGFLAGLSNLFKNKMFLQLLAAAGTDIAGGTGGKNTLQALTGNIGSQNMLKTLSEMLGGKIPPGASIKTSDKGITTFSLPSTSTEDTTGSSTGEGAQPTETSSLDRSKMLSNLFGSMLGGASPFGSSLPNLSASDLAGLSPELVLQALGARQTQEQLGQQRLRDVVNSMYNMGMLTVAERNAAVAEAGVPIRTTEAETGRLNAIRQMYDAMKTSPIPVPGIGELDLDQFSKLPDDVRAYAYYSYGNANPLSFNDWKQQVKPGETERLIDRSMKDEPFKKALLEYRRAGSTTINLAPEERALRTGYVEARIQLYNPQDREKAINKEFEKMGISDQIIAEMQGDSPKAKELRNENTKKAISRLIVAGRGKVLRESISKDGSAYVWLVEWTNMDGTKTQEVITHAIE